MGTSPIFTYLDMSALPIALLATAVYGLLDLLREE